MLPAEEADIIDIITLSFVLINFRCGNVQIL